MKEYTSKAKELNEIIEKMYLISSEANYEEIFDLFDKVYLTNGGGVDNNFRHEYSSISGKIRELNEIDVEGGKVYALDNLLQNVANVYDLAVKKQKPYIKNLFKLKDHIGLEAGRINAIEQLKWKISNGQASVESQLEYMQNLAGGIAEQVRVSGNTLGQLQLQEKQHAKNMESAQNTLESLNESAEAMENKIESIHNDSITILGIFASIVLSFTAGIVFTSSVLQNIDKASPFRLFAITLTIGFVIINIIAILLVYISKIKSVKYVKMKYPLCVKVINVILGIAILIDFVLWILMCKPYGVFIK